MSEIDRLLEANRDYAASHASTAGARPTRRLAVVTCMDVRIDVLAVLGLRVGEAHILRNAGGRVTDDVLRSLALATHALGVDTVLVMQHTGCRVVGATDDQLRHLTGADIGFFPIDDHAAALREDIQLLASTKFLSPLSTLAGAVYDVDTGAVDVLVREDRGTPTT